MTLEQFILINIGAALTASGGIFLKKLSVNLSLSPSFAFRLLGDINFWIGGMCYLFPIFIWAYLLRTMDLTKLQPMLSLVYVYTLALALFFLGEVPSLQRLAGIAVIVSGVIMVGKS